MKVHCKDGKDRKFTKIAFPGGYICQQCGSIIIGNQAAIDHTCEKIEPEEQK